MTLQRILASSSRDIPPELFLVVGFGAGATLLGEPHFELLGAEREERDPGDLTLKDSSGFTEEENKG